MAKVKFEPQTEAPTHVLLLGDIYLDGVPHWRAGKVIPFSRDVAQMLKVERVEYRPATERERALAGFVD
jgi:hypothetical protein